MLKSRPPCTCSRALGAALCVLVLATASTAAANTTRIGVLVANHKGGEDLPVLRYAERDLSRFADVLTEMGGFEDKNLVRLIDEDADDVLEELTDLEARIAMAKAKGDDVLVVFYYSGHAANGVLRLGETRLGMEELRVRIETSGADMRLAFLDSCGAGAITREKGGTKAPPFIMTVEDEMKARGLVIITSSSADEASQESDDIQGSFFTHYLVTGLRGDADENTDGKVTLGEAYEYAYSRTVSQTAASRSGVQHPTFSYDLTGAGDVVLARPAQSEVTLTFPEALEGQYFVVDMDREIFVAEIAKVRGNASRLSLPKGQYVIKKRTDTHLLMSRLSAKTKGSFVVDEGSMEKVEFDDDYAKGTPLTAGDFEDGLGFAFALGTGGQLVLGEPIDGMFPPVAYMSAQLRMTNVFTEHLMLQMDFGFGTRPHTWSVPELDKEYPMVYSQAQFGTAALARWDFGPVYIGGGPRMTALFVLASYLEEKPLGRDDYFFHPLVPGLMALAGFKMFDWFAAEIQLRGNYLYFTNDTRHLAYLETVFSAWVNF